MPSDESPTSQSTTESLIAQLVVYLSCDGRYRIEVHTPQELPLSVRLQVIKKMQEVVPLLVQQDNSCKNN